MGSGRLGVDDSVIWHWFQLREGCPSPTFAAYCAFRETPCRSNVRITAPCPKCWLHPCVASWTDDSCEFTILHAVWDLCLLVNDEMARVLLRCWSTALVFGWFGILHCRPCMNEPWITEQHGFPPSPSIRLLFNQSMTFSRRPTFHTPAAAMVRLTWCA